MKQVQSEVGPIRPPSESHSLLLRLSRNCPWNKCLFCPVYKNERFSIRKINEVKSEIIYLSNIYYQLKKELENSTISQLSNKLDKIFPPNTSFDAKRLLHWIYHGEYNIFIQDADPLLRKKEELLELIKLIKSYFPETKRITSYARANTINRFSINELKQLKEAGLSRIHMGLESGSDEVLKFVCKGFTSNDVIKACNILKESGIETSLYVIPGLGGKKLSNVHVKKTIETINIAQPDFLRLRTIGINPSMPLYSLFVAGEYVPPSEKEIVLEIKDMIEGIEESLNFFSDHNLNLLMELNGRLPDNKTKFLQTINKFLSLKKDDMVLFILERRLNKIFELNEFLNFPPDEYTLDIYQKIKDLPEIELEKFFLHLRSQNL